MYKFMFTSARGKLVYFILITLVAINSSTEFKEQLLTATYRTATDFPVPILVPIENALGLNNDTGPMMRYRAENDLAAPRQYEWHKLQHQLPVSSRVSAYWSLENTNARNNGPLRLHYMKKLTGRPFYQLLPTNPDSMEAVKNLTGLPVHQLQPSNPDRMEVMKTNPFIRVARDQIPVVDPTSVIDTFVMVTQSEVLQPARKNDDDPSRNRMNQVLESRVDAMEFRHNIKDQQGQNFSRFNKDGEGMSNNNLQQNSYISHANIMLPNSDADNVKPSFLQNTFMSHADLSLPPPSTIKTRFDPNDDMNLRHPIVQPNSPVLQVNPPAKSPYYEEVRNTEANTGTYDSPTPEWRYMNFSDTGKSFRSPYYEEVRNTESKTRDNDRSTPPAMYINFKDSEKGLDDLIHDNMMRLRAFINSEIERKENGSSYQVHPDQS